jgi:uncharacterized RDD family membrane protein YckC
VSDQSDRPSPDDSILWAAPSSVAPPTPQPVHAPPVAAPGGFFGQPSDLVVPPPPPPSYASASAPTGRQWPYASWGARVGARLIDELLLAIGWVPYVIGLVMVIGAIPPTSFDETTGLYTTDGVGDTGMAALGGLLIIGGALVALGIWLWNRVFRMGRTGQSVGKRVMRLYLVSEATGNPMGAGMCFVRELAHYVDGILMLGYLWPIWDVKRQTFADKIVSTVVAHEPSGG